LKFRSPITGHFISKAAYQRWYAPGRPKEQEYKYDENGNLPVDDKEPQDDYFDIQEGDEPEEFETPIPEDSD
jgi:hypothetical protein